MVLASSGNCDMNAVLSGQELLLPPVKTEFMAMYGRWELKHITLYMCNLPFCLHSPLLECDEI